MDRTPLVSVGMASYNHAPFLPAAIDSILNQTFRDFELIVVDDGSADSSLEILQSYAGKHPEVIRVLTHPGRQHLGISATWNASIKEARGQYWCPQASDDVSYPDRLERQVTLLEGLPDIGWVYGIADFIDEGGARLNEELGADLSAFPDLSEQLILQNLIASATTMIRMRCMTELGPFDPDLAYSDWEFWVRLAVRYPAAFLPGAVAGYRCHGYNTSLTSPLPVDSERQMENLKRSLEVLTTLRRKAEVAKDELGQPRKKALLDLSRAAFFLMLRDRASASRAAAGVFRSDPALRHDLKALAHCLRTFRSRRLAYLVIREFGIPPVWVANKAFMSALFRIMARNY